MAHKNNVVKVHGAAVYFAYVSKNAQEIADVFGVSRRTVIRWAANEPEWQKALDACSYSGDIVFEHRPTRDIIRDSSDQYHIAHQLYIQYHLERVPKHKIIRMVAEHTGMRSARIRAWKDKYKWNNDALKVREEESLIEIIA